MRKITNQTEKLAMQIAYKAHLDQTDKNDLPYILHPIAVSELIDETPVDLNETEMIYAHAAALLHDVVEDTHVTLSDLKKLFPSAVTDAVSILTRNKKTPYHEYMAHICDSKNKIAIAVKIADLTHNLFRCSNDQYYKSLAKRYERALETIQTRCENMIKQKGNNHG